MNVIEFQKTFSDLQTIVEANKKSFNKDILLTQLKKQGFHIGYVSDGTINLSKNHIDYSVGFDYAKRQWFVYKSFWTDILLPKGNKHHAQLSSYIKPHQTLTLHVDDGNGLETMDFNIDDDNVGI